MITAGYLAWAQNDPVWIENLNATWTSSNSAYSITGYVRNLTDEQYKLAAPQSLSRPSDVARATVYLSDPRTYGIVLSTKF